MNETKLFQKCAQIFKKNILKCQLQRTIVVTKLTIVKLLARHVWGTVYRLAAIGNN